MAARHLTRSAAILAGGHATRFHGQDKSALLVDGRAILDRQLEALAPLTDDIMIVGVARPFQGRVVHDIVPGCGPLGGLHAALSAARGEALFLAACDMPYLSSAFVAHLFELAGEADAVVPQSERGYHPLCAVYTRACLEPVAARLAERQLKMRELLGSVRTRVVPIEGIRQFGDPERLLTNVNTPADYAGLEALHDHKL
jgi:molybdopterin-guanine dinucleotide biosynthesis protein A